MQTLSTTPVIYQSTVDETSTSADHGGSNVDIASEPWIEKEVACNGGVDIASETWVETDVACNVDELFTLTGHSRTSPPDSLALNRWPTTTPLDDSHRDDHGGGDDSSSVSSGSSGSMGEQLRAQRRIVDTELKLAGERTKRSLSSSLPSSHSSSVDGRVGKISGADDAASKLAVANTATGTDNNAGVDFNAAFVGATMNSRRII
jgi:hypothetical protein